VAMGGKIAVKERCRSGRTGRSRKSLPPVCTRHVGCWNVLVCEGLMAVGVSPHLD